MKLYVSFISFFGSITLKIGGGTEKEYIFIGQSSFYQIERNFSSPRYFINHYRYCQEDFFLVLVRSFKFSMLFKLDVCFIR